MARLELGTSSVVLCHASMHVVRSACAQRPAAAVVTHSPEPARAHSRAWDGMGRRWRRPRAVGGAVPTSHPLHCTGQLSLVRTQEETPTGPRQRARPGHGGPGARAGTRGRLLHWPLLADVRRLRLADLTATALGQARAVVRRQSASLPVIHERGNERGRECVAGSLAATACHEPGRAARPIHSPEPILSRSPHPSTWTSTTYAC